MLPNLKLIKKYYSVFFCTILFLLTAMLPLGRNNFIFEKSMYFPVIPDNSHDLLRSWHQSFWCFLRNNFLTSWITFHLLHVTDHACSIKGENANTQKKYSEYTLLESLRIQYWFSMLNLTNWSLMKPSHWFFFVIQNTVYDLKLALILMRWGIIPCAHIEYIEDIPRTNLPTSSSTRPVQKIFLFTCKKVDSFSLPARLLTRTK